MHVACFGVFVTGANSLSLILCALLYFIRMFGITAGYHRYFSHRTYRTSRPFQFVLAMLGCSAMQKGPLWWSAHHRQHHRFSDTADDPHSPITRSVWWSHLGWILDPDSETTHFDRVRDWMRYPELLWLNRHHWVPGIVLGAVCFLIAGWSGLFVGFFLSTVLLYHGTFLVNSLCHLMGGRRYNTDDRSRNNLFVAVVTLGEGWHNNHHHYQGSANQGFYWWEIDVSYYILKMLSWVGLVWNVRTAPAHKVKDAKAAVALPAPKPEFSAAQ